MNKNGGRTWSEAVLLKYERLHFQFSERKFGNNILVFQVDRYLLLTSVSFADGRREEHGTSVRGCREFVFLG